jgi:hypothetical protein
MSIKKLYNIVAAIYIQFAIFFVGCNPEDYNPPGKQLPSYCDVTNTIAKSKNECACNIKIQSYVNEYTFTKIESNYYTLGPPCNQNFFIIKYINKVHDHNEPDLEFGFYLPQLENNDFFKVDTFQIDTIYYGEWSSTGGHGGPRYDADVTFIWDEVDLVEGIYSGKGKFIINKKIPVNYPATYYFPRQEILFEFCQLRRND